MDLIVKHELPASIIALKQEALDGALALAERAHHIAIPSIDKGEEAFALALASANAVYKEIKNLSSTLDAGRLEWGRKIMDVKKALDDSVKAALIPLEDQRAKLGQKIAAADLEQRMLHVRRLREAEEAARAEERRLIAEADAKRKAEQDAINAALPPWEAKPEPTPFDGADLVRPVQRAYVPPPPKSAVRQTTRKVLRVVDARLIPDEISGVNLWMLDTKAVEQLLRAGVVIAGAELVDETRVGANAR